MMTTTVTELHAVFFDTKCRIQINKSTNDFVFFYVSYFVGPATQKIEREIMCKSNYTKKCVEKGGKTEPRLVNKRKIEK